MEAEMEAQSAGAEDGFTQVTRKGGRRAKKRQAEQLSAAGDSADAARMDTEEARPAKRPVFPPLAGDGFLVLAGTLGEERGRGQSWAEPVASGWVMLKLLVLFLEK